MIDALRLRSNLNSCAKPGQRPCHSERSEEPL